MAQQWRATAESGLTDFRTLGFRQPGDSTNFALWESARGRLTEALTHYSIIVEDNLDGASQYQLAPTYYALAAAYSGLLQMKSEMGSAPSPWFEYYTYLQRAMNVGYKLVGARIFACWAGFNPGRDGFNWSYPNTQLSEQYGYSQLFRYLEASNMYPVAPTWCSISSSHVNTFCSPRSIASSCIRSCWSDPTPTPTYEQSTLAMENAELLHFSHDETVKIVRGSMKALQKVAGGNEPFDFPRTDLPETAGMFVDPWVTQESCSGVSGGPWGYVINP
jgi:hypothetical protein